MKYRRTLVAAILAGVAFSASAREPDLIVGLDEACPASTVPNPSYRWENGRFVRDGWVCTDVHARN
jgi:hypothetical protein